MRKSIESGLGCLDLTYNLGTTSSHQRIANNLVSIQFHILLKALKYANRRLLAINVTPYEFSLHGSLTQNNLTFLQRKIILCTRHGLIWWMSRLLQDDIYTLFEDTTANRITDRIEEQRNDIWKSISVSMNFNRHKCRSFIACSVFSSPIFCLIKCIRRPKIWNNYITVLILYPGEFALPKHTYSAERSYTDNAGVQDGSKFTRILSTPTLGK